MPLNNKNHWYDGRFYDLFIAPNQKGLFNQIINLIEPNQKIIDIGCGTGFFSFSAAKKCTSILGVDLSERNINIANQNLTKSTNSKLSFRHENIQEIISNGTEYFDYAIMTYVIHEVNEEDRVDLIKDAMKISNKIIIADYLIPRPTSLTGKMTNLIEFMAGAEHYKNFKSFVKNGGIPFLAEKAGLLIKHEIKNQNTANHITLLSYT